jgi:hypothetical protein
MEAVQEERADLFINHHINHLGPAVQSETPVASKVHNSDHELQDVASGGV